MKNIWSLLVVLYNYKYLLNLKQQNAWLGTFTLKEGRESRGI